MAGKTSAKRRTFLILLIIEIHAAIHISSGRKFDKANMRLIDERTAA